MTTHEVRITEERHAASRDGWPPKVVIDAVPVYPGNALRENIGGEVLIDYSVTADGHIVRPRVLTSEPPELFDAAALASLAAGALRT